MNTKLDWNRVVLGHVSENFDALRIPVKESDRNPGPYYYYGASGAIDKIDRYIFDGEYLLVAEDGENLRSRNTPIAFIAKGKFWVNNHAHILRGNSKADTRFLLYALTKSEIGAYLTGTTMPKLTQANLNRIPIYLPPLSEQHAIASVLGALDDKIDLNRRMNHTLESIARAIFKSWFVDFDPVRAKMDGRQPVGMDAEMAALFPDGFEESELGPIPKGWGVDKIGNICEFAYGKALKEEVRNPGQIPVYGSNGRVGWHDKPLVSGPGIVLGRKGNPGVVTWADTDLYPIDTTFFVIPKSPEVAMRFLFHLLLSIDLSSLDSDSAVPGLNRNIAYAEKVTVPPYVLTQMFAKTVQPLVSKIHLNHNESRTLASIRDTLLPKLLSGEIRVPDAEKFMEATV